MRWMIVLVALGFSTAAYAGDHKTVQSFGLFCDNQQQVETYIGFVKSGLPGKRAIEEVNKASGKNACVPFFGEFIVGAQAGKTVDMADDGSVVEIYEVLVIAYHKEGQWVKVDTPTIQFIPVMSKEDRT